MSLQVWLPLNGDLHNQGLSDIIITNNGATIDNNGKIGKCYFFNSNYIKITNLSIPINTWSLTAWAYPQADTSSGHQYIVGLNTSSASDFLGVLCFYQNKFGVRTAGTTYSSPNTSALNNWYHICATYNGINLKLYVNGVLVLTKSSPATPKAASTCYIGTRGGITGNFHGKINDVRIYDHCLSDKEVEEIAKGLILHYKLDQPANINYNLYIGSKDFTGTWVNSDKWTTSTEDYNGFIVKQRSGTWGGLAQNITATNGDIFTISFWAKIDLGGKLQSVHRSSLGNVTTGLNILDGNFSSSNIWVNTNEDGTSWQRYWATLQITSSDITYLQWRIENSVANKNLYIAGITLEKGYGTKNWSLSASEAGTTNIVYDSSGYNYNGTTIGVPTLDIDTARYNKSLRFTTNTDSVTITPYLTNDQTLNEITVSCWFKTNTLNSTTPNIFSLGENYFLRCRLANATSIWSYYRLVSTQVSETYSCKTLTDNNWHMLSFVFDNGIECVYIDGIQIGTTNRASNGTYLTCSSLKWHLAGYTANSQNFIGNLSDFRIYATALTAEQILELYNTSATIDNQGNVYAREVIE